MLMWVLSMMKDQDHLASIDCMDLSFLQDSNRWQAALCPPPQSFQAGACSLQMSIQCLHLVWNLHPDGG